MAAPAANSHSHSHAATNASANANTSANGNGSGHAQAHAHSAANAAVDLGNFGQRSKATDVVANCDLRGKYAVITGANRGIGYETAKALASRGCFVIFGCRDVNKANAAIADLKRHCFGAQCDVIPLDLTSLESVRQFVEDYLSKYDGRPLHYLVLNAAVYKLKHELTYDGYEVVYQTQHLSNFFLVRLLAEKLALSAPSRVVILSCVASFLAKEEDFKTSVNDDFFTGAAKSGAEWPSETIYANSKALNVLFAVRLSRQLATQKISVLVAQPTLVRTNLYQSDVWKHLNMQLRMFCVQSAEEAAATSTYCCVFPGLERYTGCCLTDCQISTMPKWMQDEDLQDKVWIATENAVIKALSRPQVDTDTSQNGTHGNGANGSYDDKRKLKVQKLRPSETAPNISRSTTNVNMS